MDDELEVVRHAQAGDSDAFAAIVEEHQQRIFRLAARMTGDRAAAMDVAQETFLRAYEGLRGFDGRSGIATWLHRIAVNLCLRQAERGRRMRLEDWPPVVESVAPDPDLGPEELVLREEVKVGCLTGLVRCLPFEQRAAFVLATLLELPDRQVAEILECSAEAVRARLTRAREALGAFLERRCQWIDPMNRCRCHRYIQYSRERGLVSGRELAPSDLAREELAELRDVIGLYGSLPPPRAAEGLTERVRRGIAAGEWRILG